MRLARKLQPEAFPNWYIQGGVTPIGSVVTTVIAVGQWSTVKATQKGVVNSQSRSKGCGQQSKRAQKYGQR